MTVTPPETDPLQQGLKRENRQLKIIDYILLRKLIHYNKD